MTLISPVTFVGGFVNGMGRLPCTPVELQEAPSTTQDAAAILTIIAFILWHGSPTFFSVNLKPTICLGPIDRGARVDPCQILLATPGRPTPQILIL